MICFIYLALCGTSSLEKYCSYRSQLIFSFLMLPICWILFLAACTFQFFSSSCVKYDLLPSQSASRTLLQQTCEQNLYYRKFISINLNIINIMKSLYRIPLVTSCLKPALPFYLNKNLLKQSLGDDIFSNFADAYKNVCDALSQNDTEYISQITTQSLFSKLQLQLKQLNANNLILKQVAHQQSVQIDKQQQPAQMEHFIFKTKSLKMNLSIQAIVGVNRKQVETNKDQIPVQKQRIEFNNRVYLYNMQNFQQTLRSLWNDHLLVFYVDILAKNKLYIENTSGQLVEGDNSNASWIRSVLRFETDSQDLAYKITDINYAVYEGRNYLKVTQ